MLTLVNGSIRDMATEQAEFFVGIDWSLNLERCVGFIAERSPDGAFKIIGEMNLASGVFTAPWDGVYHFAIGKPSGEVRDTWALRCGDDLTARDGLGRLVPFALTIRKPWWKRFRWGVLIAYLATFGLARLIANYAQVNVIPIAAMLLLACWCVVCEFYDITT